MIVEINITVNGEAQVAQAGLAVTTLLSRLGMPEDRVAIERNLEILPRSQWSSTIVQAGDRYEIVHMVGGG